MSTSRSLMDKRILITDVENEFGRELYTACRGEGCLIFTLVRELCRLSNVMTEFPGVVPVLLDPSNANKDQSHKLLTSLPPLDHIVNLSGEDGLEIISRAWSTWKIHDFGENKTKPLISKMKDAGGSKCLIFHSSAGSQNLMSKLKANLNPRYTDSATAQVSTSVRKSFKKLFSSGSSDPTPTKTTTTNGATSSTLAQSITSGNHHATEFAALAASLGGRKGTKGTENGQESPPSSSSSSPRSTPAPQSLQNQGPTKILSLPEKNEKIRTVLAKLGKTTQKKWVQLLKDMEKEQLAQLKQLDKDLKALRKKEKGILMAENASANVATAARKDILSADTSARILASREARVDREVDKKVEARRDADTQKIAQDKNARMEARIGKLYGKTVVKEMAEFNRIKVKYAL